MQVMNPTINSGGIMQSKSMTVTEAAKELGISRGLAYELVSRGELPSIRLGRHIIVPRHAIERLLGEPAQPSV
jgi:excisionase family DNA binding protein